MAMIKTYATAGTIKLTAAGSYTTLLLASWSVSKKPLAEITRLTTGSPVDPQSNAYPDADVVPGAMKLTIKGYLASANTGGTATYPPVYTDGSGILFTLTAGTRSLAGTGVISGLDLDAPENANVDWAYEILVQSITTNS